MSTKAEGLHPLSPAMNRMKAPSFPLRQSLFCPKKEEGFHKPRIQLTLSQSSSFRSRQKLKYSSARNIDKGKKLPKEIIKAGKEYNFDRLDRKDLASFANKRFKQAKKTISNANMHLLLDETGYFNRESDYDLYTFMNDISKLIAASGDVIEEKAIRELVNRDEDTFVFNLLDSIAAGRKDRAIAQLHNILGDGGDEFQLIGSIVSQFELMYCTKQMLDEGMQVREIASKLKANEYRIKNITKYTQGFSAEKLSKVLSSAYELSSQITTGLLKSSMALELFIAGI